MIIFGKNVIKEALKAGYKIEEIYFEKNVIDIHDELYKEIINKKIKFTFIDKQKMTEIAKGLNQGIAAKVPDYKYFDLDKEIKKDEKQVFLLLDGLEDPHNLGAILRSSDATDISGVIIPKNRSVRINETVSKVSTGAVFHVKTIMVNNINSAIDTLKSNGFWIYGADMDGELSYKDMDLKTSIGIVIGSEGFGLSRLTKEKCDYLINIPMAGKVNSLNASVSASLLLYEAFNKRYN